MSVPHDSTVFQRRGKVETLLAGAFKLLDLEFFLLDFPSTQVAELSESADPDRVAPSAPRITICKEAKRISCWHNIQ